MIHAPEDTMLGLDLGIKTGSLVQVHVNQEYNLMERWEPLVTWTKGPSVKDSLDSILDFFDRYVIPYINFEHGYAIAVDWNRNEINWAANRNHSNIKTFIAGYINYHANNQGLILRFIPPALVRSFFGYSNSKTPKNEVHRHFLSLPSLYDETGSVAKNHDLDAIILAYILDLQLRGGECPSVCRVDTALANSL